jgi:hypothetical protein
MPRGMRVDARRKRNECKAFLRYKIRALQVEETHTWPRVK